MRPANKIYIVLAGSLIRSLVCKTDFILVTLTTIAVRLTTEENRTQKFSCMLATKYTGNILGFFLQGVLLNYVNFSYFYLISIGTYLAVLLLAMFFMPENNTKHSEQRPCLNHYSKALQVMTKKPKGGTLLALWSVMLIICLQRAVRSCENDVIVLYVNKNIPSFTISQFSWYWMAERLSTFLIITVGLYTAKKIGLRDTHLSLLASFTCIVEYSMLSVAQSVPILYTAVVIGCFKTLLIPTTKSFISIIVSEEHYGKAYSIYFCFESLANILGPLVFLNMYKLTINFYSGTVYIGMATCYIVILVLCVYLNFSLEYVANNVNVTSTKEDKIPIDTDISETKYGATTKENH